MKINNKDIKFNFTVIFAFICGVIFIFATYAWFSSSLNVEIEFVNLSVNNTTGLYISLDGITYGDSVTVNRESITNDLDPLYPGNNNKWPMGKGMYPISSPGILVDNNDGDFDWFVKVREDKPRNSEDLRIGLKKYKTRGNSANFIAFDLFIKNISFSRKADNLYLWEQTGINLLDDKDPLSVGMLNSMRMGFSFDGFVDDHNAPSSVVQNLNCDNACKDMIYEPYSTSHNETAIENAADANVDLVNGEYFPTYAIKQEAKFVPLYSGYSDKYPIDEIYYKEQETFTELNEKMFEIPHGIMKMKVYIWMEGQDIDSLYTVSNGDTLSIDLQFHKDNAGYR